MAYQAAELRGWLQAESLLNLCRLADQHGVSIDTCETKAAVVEVLLAAGEEVRGPSAAPRPAEMDVVDEEPEVKKTQGELPQAAGSGVTSGRLPLGGVQLNSQGRAPPGFMSANDAFRFARQQQDPRTRTEAAKEPCDAVLGADSTTVCLDGTPAVATRVVPMRSLVRIGADGQPCYFAPIVEDPPANAMNNASVLRLLVQFVPDKQFLWFALVSRGWRAAWANREPITRIISPDTSVSQLRRSFELGLPRFVVDLESLARAGNTGMLAQARRAGANWTKATAAAASLAGQGQALRYLLLNGCPFDGTLCSSAARGGHLALLRRLRRKQFPWDRRTINEAARGGHLAILKWARAHGCKWKMKSLGASAEAGGNAEVMEWVKKLHQLKQFKMMWAVGAGE